MSELSNVAMPHEHKSYTDGLRSTAEMYSDDLPAIAAVLCDCADLIDDLATRQPNPADLIPPFRELIADMASEPPGGEVWDRSAKFAAYCARAKALIKDKNDE